MLSNEWDRNEAEKLFVQPRKIKGAERLGVNRDGTSRMRSHHSIGAKPEDFPKASKIKKWKQ